MSSELLASKPNLAEGLVLSGLTQVAQGQQQQAEERCERVKSRIDLNRVKIEQYFCRELKCWFLLFECYCCVVSKRQQARANPMECIISCWDDSTGTWEKRAVKTGAKPTHIYSRFVQLLLEFFFGKGNFIFLHVH